MLTNTQAARVRVVSFPARLYAYSFFEEFILLYPLYAVLFAETGLTTAQISSLFIIWSATAFTAEIPSGVLADMFSRRLLLVVGPVLMGAGFALWIAVPSYWSFAAGFVLWGIQGALQSGALEALVYEELDAEGQASRYPQVMGRAQAASTVAAAAAMALAAPVFAERGYTGIGVASVLACLVASILAATLPERRRHHAEHVSPPHFMSTLRAGIADVRTNRRLRLWVGFIIVISAVWGTLDEYVSLLALDNGARASDIPLLVLMVYVGVALGGLLGGVGSRVSRRGYAIVLGGGAIALAAGALIDHPAGFALIGIAFCAFQMTEIVADARIQDAANGEARSTVTSVAGFGTEVAAIAIFAVYALGSEFTSHAMLFVMWAFVYVLVAISLARITRPAGASPDAHTS